MCGISGYLDLDRGVDIGILRRMTDVIRHRGPDDEGYALIGPGGNCRGDRFLFGIWSSPPEHLGSERWWSSADVFAGTGYHPHLQWGVI